MNRTRFDRLHVIVNARLWYITLRVGSLRLHCHWQASGRPCAEVTRYAVLELRAARCA